MSLGGNRPKTIWLRKRKVLSAVPRSSDSLLIRTRNICQLHHSLVSEPQSIANAVVSSPTLEHLGGLGCGQYALQITLIIQSIPCVSAGCEA